MGVTDQAAETAPKPAMAMIQTVAGERYAAVSRPARASSKIAQAPRINSKPTRPRPDGAAMTGAVNAAKGRGLNQAGIRWRASMSTKSLFTHAKEFLPPLQA